MPRALPLRKTPAEPAFLAPAPSPAPPAPDARAARVARQAASYYERLVAGPWMATEDLFDQHILASILALARAEAATGRTLTQSTGLQAAELRHAIAGYLPHAADLFAPDSTPPVSISADETCLRDLLLRFTTDGTAFQATLAALVARRAQSPNHLWQDLGLRNRGELSQLMARHFRALASRNVSDMKWKKFLYRMICRDAAYSICTAPSCSECVDFDQCFGEESGDSLLARVRRAGELNA